jgi:hypothetical protein
VIIRFTGRSAEARRCRGLPGGGIRTYRRLLFEGLNMEYELAVTGSLPEMHRLLSDLEREFPGVQFTGTRPAEVPMSITQRGPQRHFDLYAMVLGAIFSKSLSVTVDHIIAYIKTRISGTVSKKE